MNRREATDGMMQFHEQLDFEPNNLVARNRAVELLIQRVLNAQRGHGHLVIREVEITETSARVCAGIIGMPAPIVGAN